MQQTFIGTKHKAATANSFGRLQLLYLCNCGITGIRIKWFGSLECLSPTKISSRYDRYVIGYGNSVAKRIGFSRCILLCDVCSKPFETPSKLQNKLPAMIPRIVFCLNVFCLQGPSNCGGETFTPDNPGFCFFQNVYCLQGSRFTFFQAVLCLLSLTTSARHCCTRSPDGRRRPRVPRRCARRGSASAGLQRWGLA